MRTRTRAVALAAAACLSSGLCLAPTASARGHETRSGTEGFGHSTTSLDSMGRSSSHRPRGTHTGTLTTEAIMPFSISVDGNRVYWSEGADSSVARLGRDGAVQTVVTPLSGRDLTGLEVSNGGRTIAYTSGNEDHSSTSLTVRRAGRPDLVADISGYEAAHNPDGGSTYGILAGGNPCAEAILGDLSGGPATYPGGVDSHPYAVTRLHNGWAVADAGANAILGVSASGAVSTIAVLPPQVTTLTQSQVDALTASVGAPPGALQCLVGVTYGFEPVPTDVERGEDGMLYVSTLPGGPEDPSLGARGSVYRVDPRTGRSRLVATGFLGATDLAVGDDDEIYVTEFFGGKVDRIVHGRVSTVLTAGSPLSLEMRGHTLYVGYAGNVDFETGEVLSNGSIQAVRLRH